MAEPKIKRLNPFEVAQPSGTRRLKILLWGQTGTLKTRTALQFPSPAVIDLERGTDSYAGEFKFDVLPPSSPTEILESIRFLRDSQHPYATLVIDPVTLYWAALQRKWSDIFLARLSGRKTHHHEFFELGPREWSTIKAEWAEFLRTCLQLDMNLVFTAHDKSQYEGTGADIMRKVGEMPDAEKNLERVFDIVIRCERQDEGKGRRFYGTTIKDRTNRLPPRFELSYAALAAVADPANLTRPPQAREPIGEDQLARVLACVEALGITEAAAYDRLQHYGVSRFADLSRQQAITVLERLEDKVSKVSKVSVLATVSPNGAGPIPERKDQSNAQG